MTRIEYLVDYILGPCICDDAYTGRELISPQCSRCNDGDEARESLLLSYQLGYDEHGTNMDKESPAYDIVEANRESLSKLAQMLPEKILRKSK